METVATMMSLEDPQAERGKGVKKKETITTVQRWGGGVHSICTREDVGGGADGYSGLRSEGGKNRWSQ